MPLDITFRARLWLYDGNAAWHFLTLPKAVSARIKALTAGTGKAFGSVRVTATIGHTRWKTSLFPDNKAGAYLLPVKASVRAREQLRAGDTVELSLLADLEC